MKCVLFIGILTTLTIFRSAEGEISTECPKIDSEKKITRLPHATDCEMYYSCHRGRKYLAVCPYMDKDKVKRFQFNPLTQFCDWPEYTGCTSIRKENDKIITESDVKEQTTTPKLTTITTESSLTTITTTTEIERKTTATEATIPPFSITVTPEKLQKNVAQMASRDAIIKNNYTCTEENCNAKEDLKFGEKDARDPINIFFSPIFWMVILSVLVLLYVTFIILRVQYRNKKTYEVNLAELNKTVDFIHRE